MRRVTNGEIARCFENVRSKAQIMRVYGRGARFVRQWRCPDKNANPNAVQVQVMSSSRVDVAEW